MARRRSSHRFNVFDLVYGRKPTVAERRHAADREAAKLCKRGEALQPVSIQGRTIARSFWGKAWCKNLERYSDFSNRLPRGRSYLSSGQVLDLRVEPGKVVAKVMGTRLYQVTISIDTLARDTWEELVDECAGHVSSLVELLQGKLSDGVMATVTRSGSGLFPCHDEIHLGCSCPDWATMCKHVAATLYGVGARLDAHPELLFVLRGVDASELVLGSGAASAIAGQAKDKALRAEADDLAAIFGIDMEGDMEVAAPKKPAAKKPAAKKPAAKKPAAKKPAAKKPAAKKPAAKKQEPVRPRPHDDWTLVTRSDLDVCGIDAGIVAYWESEGLLEPATSPDTWLATPLAQRRMKNFLPKQPRRRSR